MKTMNSSVSRCLKVDFKAFEKVGENMYMLSWGVVPEMERVAVYDERTGEHTFTGEVIETDLVTYESGVFVGVLNVDSLAKVFESSTRQPSVSELASMCKGMELSDEEVIPFLKGWKVSELKTYDESSEVNDCIIVHDGNELHYWASKSERNDLKNAVRDYVAMGRTEYRLDLRDLSDPGIEPTSPVSPSLAGRFFTLHFPQNSPLNLPMPAPFTSFTPAL